MAELKRKISKKTRIIIYAYAVLILFIFTSVCSYAWFNLTRTPRVSNLSLYVNSVQGMELSLDPRSEVWTRQISYDELFEENYKLKPATWSEEKQQFFGANYSVDGRLTDTWDPLTDELHSNTLSRDNYYCKGTLYARAGSKVNVSLAEAVVANEDATQGSGTYLIGRPIWNAETLWHDNGGKGAETAIRLGIKITRLDEYLEPAEGTSQFYIYEPNGDTHIDESEGYVNTPSIDGTEQLIDDTKLIKQSTSRWGEHAPVQKDLYIHKMGKFTTPTELFTIEADEVVKIEIYVWLEGMDVDCTNAIADAQLIGNLQFNAVTGGGSGLVPIPPEDDNAGSESDATNDP